MKFFLKPLIIFFLYNLLLVSTFGNQDIMMPIFAVLSLIVTFLLYDLSKNFFQNFLLIFGLFFLAEMVALFLNGVHYPTAVSYLLMIILSNTIVYLLKNQIQHFKLT